MSSKPNKDNVRISTQNLGFPNVISPFCQMVTSPRVSMENQHLAQMMVLDNPEFNRTFTGIERKMRDYTIKSSEREFDCTIVRTVPKYQRSLFDGKLGNSPCTYVIVLTHEPGGKQRLDYFTVDRYFMGKKGFGFLNKYENTDLIQPDKFLHKDEIITRSPSEIGDNLWGAGTNLNVIYGSFTETVEDAFVIGESASKKLQSTIVDRKVIPCRMDRRPVNLYGTGMTDMYEKFLPDIGSYVRHDGILCAFRPIHWTTSLADTDYEALKVPLPLQDEIIYIEPGSKILDITFNFNKSKIRHTSSYDQAKIYAKNAADCWEMIYETYMKYKGKYRLTPKMDELVKTAIYYMLADGRNVRSVNYDYRKIMKNAQIKGYSGRDVDFMEAVVTYSSPRFVEKGTKLTDLSGAKGVVGRIVPDECMPVDMHGNRADVIIDMNSPVSRNNPSQFYEQWVNAVAHNVRTQCKKDFEEKGSDPAFETLMSWYDDINPKQTEACREVCDTQVERAAYVRDAIDNGVKTWVRPFMDTLTPSDEDQWNALENAMRWGDKWNVQATPVTYKTAQADGSYKSFTTIDEFIIASKYFIVLNKVPEIFASGPASVNHIRIPTKLNYESKNYPVTVSPYRFGEDELRMMCVEADPREVSRFQNLLANSPVGMEEVIKAFLLSEHPSRVMRMPITNGRLLETSAPLNLFHMTTSALGIQTRDTKIENFEVPDDISDAIWSSDVIDSIRNPVDILSDDDTPRRGKAEKKSKAAKSVDDTDGLDLPEPTPIDTDDDEDVLIVETGDEPETEDAD